MERQNDLSMYKHPLFVALLACIVTSLACHSTAVTTQTDFAKYTKATVIDYSEVSGCGFLLMLEDGSKLQASTLPKKFLHNGMDVWIQYTIKKSASICQAGKIIDLNDIRKR